MVMTLRRRSGVGLVLGGILTEYAGWRWSLCVSDRRRGGAYLAVLAMAIGNVAAFFFLSFHLQSVLGFPPVLAGIAFLPYTAAIVLGVRMARRLLTNAPVRLLLAPGLLATAAGLALLGLLRPDSSSASPPAPYSASSARRSLAD